LQSWVDIAYYRRMATPTRKTKTEPAPSRVAAHPQAERRVDSARQSVNAAVGPSFDEVSRRAFQIWEQTGRPDGRDLENWLQAEQELRSAT